MVTSADEQGPATATSAGSTALAATSLRNSFAFGGALIASWVLVLVGRLVIPRVLSNADYGTVSLLESTAVLGISVVSLGFDTHIRKAVTEEPAHARRIMQPVRRMQIGLGAVVIAVLAAGFLVIGEAPRKALIVALFGVAQLSLTVGQNANAYLHTLHRVRETTISTVAVKIAWLCVLIGVAATDHRLYALPVAAAVSEIARARYLERRATHQFQPDRTARLREVVPVLKESLPYYLNSLNITANTLALPVLIGMIAGEGDVALYASASMLMTMPQMFLPLIGPVLVPALVRERANGDGTVWVRTRDLMTLLLPLLTVVAGVIAIFGELIIRLAVGSRYADAAAPLAFMALGLPATFGTVLLSTAMIVVGRSWQTTRINWVTMVGLVTTGALLLSLIGRGNPGAPAAAGALVLIVFEWITVAWMCAVSPVGVMTRRCAFHVLIAAAGWAVAEAGRWFEGQLLVTRLIAAGLLGVVAVRDLPRLVRTVRGLLKRPAEA